MTKQEIKEKIKEHKKIGDLCSWMKELERKNEDDSIIVRQYLKQKYAKKIAKHRQKGDLYSYFFDECCRMDLSNLNYNNGLFGWSSVLYGIKENPLDVLACSLTRAEQKMVDCFLDVMHPCVGASRGLRRKCFKYLYKKSAAKRNPTAQKECQSLRAMLPEFYASSLDKYIKIQVVKRIFFAAAVIFLVGICVFKFCLEK